MISWHSYALISFEHFDYYVHSNVAPHSYILMLFIFKYIDGNRLWASPLMWGSYMENWHESLSKPWIFVNLWIHFKFNNHSEKSGSNWIGGSIQVYLPSYVPTGEGFPVLTLLKSQKRCFSNLTFSTFLNSFSTSSQTPHEPKEYRTLLAHIWGKLRSFKSLESV